MRFSVGMWDNINFRDVYMNVISVNFEGKDHTKLTVNWWHRDGYPLGVKQDVVIKSMYYKDWTLL